MNKKFMKKISHLMLAVFTLSMLSGAITVSLSTPVIAASATLNPVADTDTQSDNSSGTNAVLNASQWCNIFMKFDLSSISGNITSAILYVNHPVHSSNHTLNLSSASPDSWSEGGTKPALGDVISSQTVTSAGNKQFDVTSQVKAELSGDKLVTFGLSTNLGSWEQYNSRESSNKPQLVVTYSDPTPPASGKLTGSIYGSNPATNANAFDGNTGTYFDNGAVNGYVGIDLGAGNAQKITKIRFYPCGTSSEPWLKDRAAGTYEGSNDGYNYATLATVSSVDNYGKWYEIPVTDQTSYRYLRFRGSQYFTTQIAEIEFYGSTATPTPLPTGNMQVGINFWDKGWGNGWTDYFVAGINWSSVTNPWKTEFLNDIAPFKCLRFMDWGPTNDSTVTDWSQRVLKTSNNYTSNGIAYEWMIDLCNRTNKNMWICVPHQVDANYWTQLATLIKNNLNSNLKCYVEYSNETWNGTFQQEQYCIDKGVANGLPGMNQWYQGGAFSIWQSTKIFKAFSDVFGSQMSSRIVRVCSFSGNFDIFDQGYNTIINSSAWNPYGQKADLLAIAPYIGMDLNGSDAQIQSKFHAQIDDTLNNYIIPAKNIANKYGLPLGCYEGGQSLYTNAHVWSRNPAIYTEYTYMLGKWKPYFDLYNSYCLYSTYSSGSAWGDKEYAGQSTSTAYRYKAITDWINANP